MLWLENGPELLLSGPALVATQREYFLSGQTRSASWRRWQLEALKASFRRTTTSSATLFVDVCLMDIAYNVKEADYALKHLAEWMKPERVPTPLLSEPVRGRCFAALRT